MIFLFIYRFFRCIILAVSVFAEQSLSLFPVCYLLLLCPDEEEEEEEDDDDDEEPEDEPELNPPPPPPDEDLEPEL